LDTGMRASELCGLTLDRLGSDSAIVYGKGRKERTVGPIGRQCQRQLLRYIERFRVGRAGVETVFTTDEGDPMTLSSLDGLLKWIRDEAGITGVRVSAHTFRHTFAVSYLQQPGADIYKLKLLLGHSNVTTTELYLADFEQRQARQGSSVADTIYAHSGLTGTSQRGILRRGQAVHHGDN
jgi:site-specific recombinase XerD